MSYNRYSNEDSEHGNEMDLMRRSAAAHDAREAKAAAEAAQAPEQRAEAAHKATRYASYREMYGNRAACEDGRERIGDPERTRFDAHFAREADFTAEEIAAVKNARLSRVD